MAGKIIKIAPNDVSGKVDERKVVVFSIFEHTKYMNNYAIFTYEGEYDKKKLYYGSIHIKDNCLIVFSVNDNIKQYIEQYLSEYENNQLEDFKILDISKIEKIDIVSCSIMDYDKLQLLDDLSIKREVKKEEVVEKEKKPIFLYFLIVFLTLMAIGLTIFYLNPDLFAIKFKELVCENTIYDENLKLSYDINKDIKFDYQDKVDKIDVIRIYTFLDSDSYYQFKDNNEHLTYFNNGEGYKYIDDSLQFRLFYQENSVIDDYEEMLTYLKKEGFSCEISEYEK